MQLQFFETKILINLLQVSVFLLKKSFFSKINTIVILVFFLLFLVNDHLIELHLIEIVFFHLLESFNNESFIFYHLIEFFETFQLIETF